MDTELKTKNNKSWIFVLIAIAIVVAFTYLRQPNQSSEMKVPKELVLGQTIDSSNVKLDFPDPEKVDVVQFEVGKPKEELAVYYRSYLVEKGWKVFDERVLSAGGIQIVALKSKDKLHVNIFIISQGSSGSKVIINYWKD